MITGSFHADDYEARVHLAVRGRGGQEVWVEAVIDTGYTGFLTLPPSVVSSLDLLWLGKSLAVLGDGSVHPFNVYEATVLWNDSSRAVEVDASEADPMIG